MTNSTLTIDMAREITNALSRYGYPYHGIKIEIAPPPVIQEDEDCFYMDAICKVENDRTYHCFVKAYGFHDYDGSESDTETLEVVKFTTLSGEEGTPLTYKRKIVLGKVEESLA